MRRAAGARVAKRRQDGVSTQVVLAGPDRTKPTSRISTRGRRCKCLGSASDSNGGLSGRPNSRSNRLRLRSGVQKALPNAGRRQLKRHRRRPPPPPPCASPARCTTARAGGCLRARCSQSGHSARRSGRSGHHQRPGDACSDLQHTAAGCSPLPPAARCTSQCLLLRAAPPLQVKTASSLYKDYLFSLPMVQRPYDWTTVRPAGWLDPPCYTQGCRRRERRLAAPHAPSSTPVHAPPPTTPSPRLQDNACELLEDLLGCLGPDPAAEVR